MRLTASGPGNTSNPGAVPQTAGVGSPDASRLAIIRLQPGRVSLTCGILKHQPGP